MALIKHWMKKSRKLAENGSNNDLKKDSKGILSQHLSSKPEYLSHDWFPLHFFKANSMAKWIFYADVRARKREKNKYCSRGVGLVRSFCPVQWAQPFKASIPHCVGWIFTLIMVGQWPKGSKRRITTIIIISPFSGLLKLSCNLDCVRVCFTHFKMQNSTYHTRFSH